MSVSIESFKQDASLSIQDEDEDLLEEDGEPLESDWHRLAMTLLIDVTVCHLGDRDDFFVGGNMFMYFDKRAKKKKKAVRGPDYFLVWDVSPRPARKQWVVWKENGQFPDLIIEMGSPTTIKIDKTAKKRIYEKKFRTREYFVYDPDTGELFGWRLENGRYQTIVPNEHGWLWCDELGLWLGTWRGRYQLKDEVFLRFYDREGRLVPTAEEAQRLRADAEKQLKEAEQQRADAERREKEAEKQRADAERREKEAEKQRADAERREKEAEKQRADAERREKEAEKQRADAERREKEAEKQRADAEKQRADIAEAELARLRAKQSRRKKDH